MSVTYAAQLGQCTAGDPEALVAISYPAQAGVYLREALEGSIIDEFVFVDGTKDHDMFANLGWPNFDGMRGTAPVEMPTALGTDFDADYMTEYGALPQIPFVRDAYDAVVTIALAAAAAGTNNDSPAIRDSLRDVTNAPGTEYGSGGADLIAAFAAVAGGAEIDYRGASGPINLDSNGDNTIGAIEVWQVDGAAEALKTIQITFVD